MLLGYLPILEPTSQMKKCIFKEAKNQTFHHAMNIILKQLIPTAKTGMMIPGPDRKICRCFLILISYSMDYPKACMIYQIKKGLYV
jgi:hypothetical protein